MDENKYIACGAPLTEDQLNELIADPSKIAIIHLTESTLEDKELLDYLANLNHPFDLSFRKVEDDKIIRLLFSYLRYRKSVYIPLLTKMTLYLVIENGGKRWREFDKHNPFPVGLRYKLDEFGRNNKEELDKWNRFYQSLYRLYRISQGLTPIVTSTKPLSTKDIGLTVMDFENIPGAIDFLCNCFPLKDGDFLYDFDETFSTTRVLDITIDQHTNVAD